MSKEVCGASVTQVAEHGDVETFTYESDFSRDDSASTHVFVAPEVAPTEKQVMGVSRKSLLQNRLSAAIAADAYPVLARIDLQRLEPFPVTRQQLFLLTLQDARDRERRARLGRRRKLRRKLP